MGLDMYAFTRQGALPAQVDFDRTEDDQKIFYWRKHPNLHGWMEALYREKGGKGKYFNCDQVALTPEDM